MQIRFGLNPGKKLINILFIQNVEMARRRKPKKKKLLSTGNLMAIFIVVIMVTSILGFMYGGSGNTQGNFVYEDMDFGYDPQGILIMQTSQGPLRMNYHPDTVLRDPQYNISMQFTDSIKEKRILYFTYPPEDQFKEGFALVQFDIKENLEDRFGITVYNAFTDENTFGLPVMQCEDAGSSELVLELQSANQTRTGFEGNCMKVYVSKAADILFIRDSIIYKMYGLGEQDAN